MNKATVWIYQMLKLSDLTLYKLAATREILVHVKSLFKNMYAQLYSGIRGLKFVKSLHLCP